MSVLLQQRAAVAAQRRSTIDLERESYRVRWAKILCGLLLGVCFWFSVPYSLPKIIDPNPQKAAADEAAVYEGNFSRQIAMPAILVISLYMLWRLPRRGRFSGHLMLFPLLYVGWAIVSAVWSEDPAVTRKRLVVFAINAFFAWALARTFSVLEMALLGMSTTGVVGVLSLIADIFVAKRFAPLDPDYRFMGVMTANYQAESLVVFLICAMTVAQRRPKWINWIAPAMGFALVLLYLTRSRLSAILCIVMMAIMVARFTKTQMQPQTRAIFVVAGMAIAIPALIFVAGRNGAGAAQSAFMMGRTDTENTSNLSNRAPLWSELMESAVKRPLIGFGYEAFWTPARVEGISADQGWLVPNAHDTYLDQLLSLGAVGAVLYIGMLWGAIVVAWRRYLHARSEISLMPAILLTWLALSSMAESVPLDPYLPTMLAYSCIAKMCMLEGSEAENDRFLGKSEMIGGVTLEAAR